MVDWHGLTFASFTLINFVFTGEEKFQFDLTGPVASLGRKLPKILCHIPTDPEFSKNSLVDPLAKKILQK